MEFILTVGHQSLPLSGDVWQCDAVSSVCELDKDADLEHTLRLRGKLGGVQEPLRSKPLPKVSPRSVSLLIYSRRLYCHENLGSGRWRYAHFSNYNLGTGFALCLVLLFDFPTLQRNYTEYYVYISVVFKKNYCIFNCVYVSKTRQVKVGPFPY